MSPLSFFHLRKRVCLLMLAAWGGVAPRLHAESPSISHAAPAAILPGQTVEVTLFGKELGGATDIQAALPAATSPTAAIIENNGKSRLRVRFETPADAPLGFGAVRVLSTNGLSKPILMMVDDLPSVPDAGTNTSIAAAQKLPFPIAVDGDCRELQSKFFRFRVAKGQRFSVEMVAQRLGSQLLPMLRLLDADGRELLSRSHDPATGADCRFAYTSPAEADYIIEIHDIRHQGGGGHRFRMRLGDFPLVTVPYPMAVSRGAKQPLQILGYDATAGAAREHAVAASEKSSAVPLSIKHPGGTSGSALVNLMVSDGGPEVLEIEPNNTLSAATELSLPGSVNGRFDVARDRDFFRFHISEKQRVRFLGTTRSLGSPCDLFLQIYQADGKKVGGGKVPKSDSDALIQEIGQAGDYFLMVEEANRFGGPEMAYHVAVERWEPGFTLLLNTETVEAETGSVFELEVEAARDGMNEAIELSVDGLPDGFEVQQNKIEANAKSGKLKIKAPEGWEPGSAVALRIAGSAKAGGRTISAPASTLPALRKLFPYALHLPHHLDGLVTVGFKANPKASETAASGQAP